MKGLLARVVVATLLAVPALAQEDWLHWTADRASAVGAGAYQQGRVGSLFTTRLLKTERATNYKLAATWITPDVARATVRLAQISERLSDEAARLLLAEADLAGRTAVLIEIDPREGSGVVPDSWSAFLQPVTGKAVGRSVTGEKQPRLRNVRALQGVRRRNYDYDQFWIVFPLRHDDGSPVFPADATAAELVVRIYDREGTVRWPIPAGFAGNLPPH